MTTNLKPILTMAALFLAVVLIWQIASITGFAGSQIRPANVTVSNSVPTAGPITCTNPIAPTACANITESCWVLINDDNGQGDIASWTGELYDSGAQPGGCTAEVADKCYVGSCTNVSYNSTAYNLTCTYNFRYFARDAEINWTARINVTDKNPSTGSNTNTALTVTNLTAIDVTQTYLDFGTLSVGQQSSAVTTTVQNCGNFNMSVSVSGTNLPCNSQGTINVGNMTYNATSTLPGTNLTASNVASGLDVLKATADTGSSSSLYWWIKIPTGVKGVCSGNVTFTANRDT